MELKLYITNDDENVINKTINNEKIIPINLKVSEDILQPNIILSNDNFDKQYNYAYIDFFKRYYFIRNIEHINATHVKISLDVDVLESYKNDILNADSVITKKGTQSYINGSVDYDSRSEKDIYKSDVTLDDSNSLILTTIGG